MKVVTSEYSRRMAHNLDDLRERWALSKQAQDNVVKIKEPERFKTDYFYKPKKINHEVIFDQLADLSANIRKHLNEIDQINSELRNRNIVDATGERLNPRQYNAHIQALEAELNYKNKLVRYLKSVEKAYHMNRDHMIKFSKYEDAKTELLSQCNKLFAKLASQKRVEYTKEERVIIDGIWAYLCQEFDPDKSQVALDEPHKLGGDYFTQHWPRISPFELEDSSR